MDKFKIGNFKAFSDLQTIPLKPITIIFGPNSSGKSSVIHSLLLARHGVDTHSLDATYPSIAGHSVDLGGFRQYIHRRNVENRLQWVAEISISSLPDKLANELAKADKLSVHITAGLQLEYGGEPVPGAVPFTQVCEYRIDDEPFMQFTRGNPKSNFRLALLNKDHPVFEPILQAMILSSTAQQSLNKDDWKLLNELVDSIVPKISFPGDSDFLPGADIDPDLLDSISHPGLYDREQNEFASLGDLGRSVRLFLPRMLMRFHSGVHQALGDSLRSMTYLGPLRSIPPRHMAFSDESAFGHPAEGAQAWRELEADGRVRGKVNEWLGKLKTPYRIQLESFYSSTVIEGMVETLQEEIGSNSISEFLRNIPESNLKLRHFIMKIQAEESDIDALYDENESDFVDLDDFESEVSELKIELEDEESAFVDYEELFKNRILPRLKELFDHKKQPGSSDLILYDIAKRTPVSYRDVGIGVSQVLPVLVQAYASKQAIVAMEQPEIHLHPALQAELGDVFIESALGEQRNRFVLETHSEHLILRILRRIRESSKMDKPMISSSDIAVLYVEPSPDGAEIYEMEISDDGQILSPWPGGFFPERMNEMFGDI